MNKPFILVFNIINYFYNTIIIFISIITFIHIIQFNYYYGIFLKLLKTFIFRFIFLNEIKNIFKNFSFLCLLCSLKTRFRIAFQLNWIFWVKFTGLGKALVHFLRSKIDLLGWKIIRFRLDFTFWYFVKFYFIFTVILVCRALSVPIWCIHTIIIRSSFGIY